jgi:hypothetical protein
MSVSRTHTHRAPFSLSLSLSLSLTLNHIEEPHGELLAGPAFAFPLPHTYCLTYCVTTTVLYAGMYTFVSVCSMLGLETGLHTTIAVVTGQFHLRHFYQTSTPLPLPPPLGSLALQ